MDLALHGHPNSTPRIWQEIHEAVYCNRMHLKKLTRNGMIQLNGAQRGAHCSPLIVVLFPVEQDSGKNHKSACVESIFITSDYQFD